MIRFLLLVVASFIGSRAALGASATPSVGLLAPSGVQQNQVVNLRFHTHVRYNLPDPRLDNRKILFGSALLWPRPANGGFYALQTNVTSEGFRYADQGCSQGPPAGPPNQADLAFASSDQPALCPGNTYCPASNVCPNGGPPCTAGHIGLKPSDTTVFPRFASGTDLNNADTIAQARSQLNLNDADLTVELDRGTTYTFTSPQSGWGSRWLSDGQGGSVCVADLPAGTYRSWIGTVAVTTASGTQTYSTEYVVDNANGQSANYIEVQGAAGDLFGLVTEFAHCVGFYQQFVWGFEFRREGSQVWEPMNTFEVGGPDASNPYHGWFGLRMAEYQGRSAIEMSNDGTDTYFIYGDGPYTLPADPATLPTVMGCNQNPAGRWCLPTLRWAAEQTITADGRTVTVAAVLDKPALADVHVGLIFGGTAQTPSDYTLQTPDLFIPAGQATGNVVIDVADNSNSEPPETITLQLKAPLGDHSAINPNDPCPAVTAGEPAPNPVKMGQIVVHTITILSSCGNGTVEAGEQCEPGPNACCTAACQLAGANQPCSDGNVCTVNETCNAAGTTCGNGSFTDATCDDGNPCTAASVCYNGVCSPLSLTNCDDGNVHTKDSCNPATGCVHTANQWQSLCGNGVVDHGVGEQCDDGNTRDGDCCSSDCHFEPAFSPCFDNNYCTYPDYCSGVGTCITAGCSTRVGIRCGAACGVNAVCSASCACQ